MQNCIRVIRKLLRKCKKLLGAVFTSTVNLYRDLYRNIRRKRLTNRDFTIISNNCCGGIMYHALKERFLSPTINLSIPSDYYFEFLNHLDHYIHTAPEEVPFPDVTYPVGRISRDDKEIYIHFMHYSSFSEACEKWLERGGRVRPDNLYVIFNTAEPDCFEEFAALDYDHKAMLTNCDGLESVPDNVYHIPIYCRTIAPGVILEHKSRISVHRWLDDFDYVSFLNKK